MSSRRTRRLLVTAVIALFVAGSTGVWVRRQFGSDPFLGWELWRMESADGDVRRAALALSPSSAERRAAEKRVERLDRRHTARLEEIVDRHGWPGKSPAGNWGSHAAWTLVQHADLDHALQRRMLALMVRAGPREVDQHDVAYLSDRLLVAEGRPQEFGTQFTCRQGRTEPVTPVADPATVDRRRARMGLETLEENRRRIDRTFPCRD